MNRFVEICYDKFYNLIAGRSLEMYQEKISKYAHTIAEYLNDHARYKNICTKMVHTVEVTRMYMLNRVINAVLVF